MFALADMLHLFTNKLPCLRGRRQSLPLVFARSFNGFFFWHSKTVSLARVALDVSPVVAARPPALKLPSRYILYHAKHRRDSPAQAEVQRHKSDRVVVHGIARLHSDDCQGSAAAENAVRREARFIFRSGDLRYPESPIYPTHPHRSRPQKPVRRHSPQLFAYRGGSLFCRADRDLHRTRSSRAPVVPTLASRVWLSRRQRSHAARHYSFRNRARPHHWRARCKKAEGRSGFCASQFVW